MAIIKFQLLNFSNRANGTINIENVSDFNFYCYTSPKVLSILQTSKCSPQKKKQNKKKKKRKTTTKKKKQKKKKRHYESVSNFKVGFKPLLQQGLSEPEFYGDLFKEIVSRAVFSDQIRKLTIRDNCIGYNINIMQQNACFAVNPITFNNFSSLLIALWLAGPT